MSVALDNIGTNYFHDISYSEEKIKSLIEDDWSLMPKPFEVLRISEARTIYGQYNPTQSNSTVRLDGSVGVL